MWHPFSILVDDRLAVFFEECSFLRIWQEVEHGLRRVAKARAEWRAVPRAVWRSVPNERASSHTVCGDFGTFHSVARPWRSGSTKSVIVAY